VRAIESDERRAVEQRTPREMLPVIDSFLTTSLVAIESFDAYKLEQTLRAAVLKLPADQVLDEVFGPLLFTIGSLWHQGQLKPANEHLASAVIRRVLVWMSDNAAPDPTAPVLLVSTPVHCLHELGAMLVATTAAQHGWRAIYLGPNLPADEIARAAVHARADAVALSLVYPESDEVVASDIRKLAKALPSNVALVAGGRAAPTYARATADAGARVLTSLSLLRQWLHERATTVRARRVAR
jgi:methylmalonyl-CoA mutase cobalamin-binding subunit